MDKKTTNDPFNFDFETIFAVKQIDDFLIRFNRSIFLFFKCRFLSYELSDDMCF